MKKYISILIAVLGILSVSSCAKFLDYSSKGSPTEDQFFQTDAQAIDAVKSIYARLPQEGFMGREFYWEQAVASDIVWGKTRSFNTLATFEYTGDEGPIAGVFNNAYKEGMNRCNWIINSLLKKKENTELTAVETRSLGEAYFMRAYYHFLIAYRYGTKDLGVPFVAYETVEGGYNNEIPEQQETVMKNYELIIADLQKSEELLPRVEDYDDANIGRACKQSAVAVMAKVYAYWATWDKSQWPNVITCVDKLENTYGRGLHPVFTDLFAPDVTKFFTKEYCWGYPSKGGQNNAGNGSVEFPGISLEDKGWGKFNGWGQFKPTLDIYEEMAKDNVGGVKNERLAATILEYGDVFPYFGEDRVFWSSVNVESGSCSRSLRPIRSAWAGSWTTPTGLVPSSTGRSSASRTACSSVLRRTSSPVTAPPLRRTSTRSVSAPTCSRFPATPPGPTSITSVVASSLSRWPTTTPMTASVGPIPALLRSRPWP